MEVPTIELSTDEELQSMSSATPELSEADEIMRQQRQVKRRRVPFQPNHGNPFRIFRPPTNTPTPSKLTAEQVRMKQKRAKRTRRKEN